MKKLIARLRRDDEGAALVEYGMLVGLIALACLAAVTLMGTSISGLMTAIANALNNIPIP